MDVPCTLLNVARQRVSYHQDHQTAAFWLALDSQEQEFPHNIMKKSMHGLLESEKHVCKFFDPSPMQKWSVGVPSSCVWDDLRGWSTRWVQQKWNDVTYEARS